MAGIQFTVSYTQSDDSKNGTITFNGVGILASGRLDKVGDFVFVDSFRAQGLDVTVECVRTSRKRMQIRSIFLTGGVVEGGGGLLEGDFCYDNVCTVVEKVLDDVKIDFDTY